MESLPGLQQSGEGKAVASGVASKSVVLPLDVDSNKSRAYFVTKTGSNVVYARLAEAGSAIALFQGPIIPNDGTGIVLKSSGDTYLYVIADAGTDIVTVVPMSL